MTQLPASVTPTTLGLTTPVPSTVVCYRIPMATQTELPVTVWVVTIGIGLRVTMTVVVLVIPLDSM